MILALPVYYMETFNKEMFVLPVFSLSALLHVMSAINQILIKS